MTPDNRNPDPKFAMAPVYFVVPPLAGARPYGYSTSLEGAKDLAEHWQLQEPHAGSWVEAGWRRYIEQGWQRRTDGKITFCEIVRFELPVSALNTITTLQDDGNTELADKMVEALIASAAEGIDALWKRIDSVSNQS